MSLFSLVFFFSYIQINRVTYLNIHYICTQLNQRLKSLLLMSYKENLQKIEDSLQGAIDHIKTTLTDEHPANSGDKLVEIADDLTKARHKLIDLLHE